MFVQSPAAFSKYLFTYTFLFPLADSPNTSDISFPALGSTDADIPVPISEPLIDNADADASDSISKDDASPSPITPSPSSTPIAVECKTPISFCPPSAEEPLTTIPAALVCV